jgi:hypothetical protein
VTGQIVKTISSLSNLSNVSINISDLTPGIYFVTMEDSKKNQTTKKVIIE